MADLFVSYSRVNRNRISGVSDALEKSGHCVWWDGALAPRDNYAVLVEKKIDAARCCIVTWSKRARGGGALLAATAFGLVRIGRASRR